MSDENARAREDKPKADAGQAEVQATVDEAEDQGFLGVEVDPTPNANYTVAGVTSGAPTPETDKAAADAAAAAIAGPKTDKKA